MRFLWGFALLVLSVCASSKADDLQWVFSRFVQNTDTPEVTTSELTTLQRLAQAHLSAPVPPDTLRIFADTWTTNIEHSHQVGAAIEAPLRTAPPPVEYDFWAAVFRYGLPASTVSRALSAFRGAKTRWMRDLHAQIMRAENPELRTAAVAKRAWLKEDFAARLEQYLLRREQDPRPPHLDPENEFVLMEYFAQGIEREKYFEVCTRGILNLLMIHAASGPTRQLFNQRWEPGWQDRVPLDRQALVLQWGESFRWYDLSHRRNTNYGLFQALDLDDFYLPPAHGLSPEQMIRVSAWLEWVALLGLSHHPQVALRVQQWKDHLPWDRIGEILQVKAHFLTTLTSPTEEIRLPQVFVQLHEDPSALDRCAQILRDYDLRQAGREQSR